MLAHIAMFLAKAPVYTVQLFELSSLWLWQQIVYYVIYKWEVVGLACSVRLPTDPNFNPRPYEIFFHFSNKK
jgi:hypothetical protein